MSRKRKAPKKLTVIDPKYKSTIIPKLINSIMYDGKKTIAEKIIYDAIEKIKSKSKDEPLNVFNDAINNIRPTVEVRSRRVGGATYQVPVEVKSKRSQALALRWLVEASRKRKDKKMSDKIFNEIYDAYQNRGSAIKKKEDTHKMAESNKAFAHFRW
jgi:small subunit ribosomal protein S7